MSSTKNITPGTAKSKDRDVLVTDNGREMCVAQCKQADLFGKPAQTYAQANANAALYAQAHNIANQTGCSPKELMGQRDEAVRLLGQLLATVRALPGDTEIGFDGVMTLKRCDLFLKSLSTT